MTAVKTPADRRNNLALAPQGIAIATDPQVEGDLVLTAHQACHLAGLTYRQLDYGTRVGKFPCSVPAEGSGSRRFYTLADLAAIAKAVAVLHLSEHIESLAYAPPATPLRPETLSGEPV